MSDPETPPEEEPVVEPPPEPPPPEEEEARLAEVPYAGDPNEFGRLSDDGLEVVTLVHVRDDEVEVVEEQPA